MDIKLMWFKKESGVFSCKVSDVEFHIVKDSHNYSLVCLQLGIVKEHLNTDIEDQAKTFAVMLIKERLKLKIETYEEMLQILSERNKGHVNIMKGEF